MLMNSFLFLFISLYSAKVVISEVVPHSDTEDGYYDYIELWNDDDVPFDVSGYFLSDSGNNKTKCQLRAGSILQPDEYRSFPCQSVVPNGRDVPYPNASCPFRLSKLNDNIFFGKTSDNTVRGVYTELSNMNIGATVNRIANSRWSTSDKEDRHMISFPSENMPNRYPIVGPFTVTEVVWDVPPGKLQWIKFTCLYGQYDTSFDSPCRLTNRQGSPFSLRLEEQKDLFTDADQATPVSLAIPTSPLLLPNGASYYLTNGDPAAFRTMYANDPRISSLTFVAGPWVGNLVDPVTKNVFFGITTKEHSGDYWIENWNWKFNKTKEWRRPSNGGMYKLSKFGVTPEPDNWVGIGDFVPCNLTDEFPQSTCPKVDKCTQAQCLNISGTGRCIYNSMVCNHRNFDLCYPMEICKLPAPARYNGNAGTGLGGCRLTNQVFGHTTADITAYGMYGPYPEKLWYNIGCKNLSIDCEVTKWSKWNYCPKCHNSYNQSRRREIKHPASVATINSPAGKCGDLNQTRLCGSGAEDIVCGRIFFHYVNWKNKWAEFINPSTQPLDISDWVLKQGCEPVKSGDWVDFKDGTIIAPGQVIRKQFNNFTITSKTNVLCLLEFDKGEFTGSRISFDPRDYSKSLN